MAVKKVHYNGSSKIIKALCKAVNDIIDSGGSGGDTVTITPTLLSGNKIADYTINGVADELYIPDDGKDMTETFTSSDVADGSATSWTSVAKLDSGETHSSIFAKMSQMFKNVRFLYKTLGNTDLSAIGGGTVTDIVKSNYTRLGLKSRVTKQAKTFTAVKNKTTATAYSVNIALSGYSPIGYSMIHGYSTQNSDVIIGVENFTESVISGFYINKLSVNATVTFVIAYSRTTD
jgi:hypothetical protein